MLIPLEYVPIILKLCQHNKLLVKANIVRMRMRGHSPHHWSSIKRHQSDSQFKTFLVISLDSVSHEDHLCSSPLHSACTSIRYTVAQQPLQGESPESWLLRLSGLLPSCSRDSNDSGGLPSYWDPPASNRPVNNRDSTAVFLHLPVCKLC